MDDRLEIEDYVTMAQFNELRQNIEERANGLANDLQAILQRLQHIPHVAENASNHEDDVEETAEEAAERVAREQQERRQRAVPC
jgi:C4-dicarboxylate-specific signal transduction histidine kinase